MPIFEVEVTYEAAIKLRYEAETQDEAIAKASEYAMECDMNEFRLKDETNVIVLRSE